MFNSFLSLRWHNEPCLLPVVTVNSNINFKQSYHMVIPAIEFFQLWNPKGFLYFIRSAA